MYEFFLGAAVMMVGVLVGAGIMQPKKSVGKEKE